MRSRAEFAAALVVQILGAGGALLVATRSWQTITTVRPRPFSADVLQVSGRTIDAAPTALALVALAGVVAVLATKGAARRVIGGLVALAGAGLVWRSCAAIPALSPARATAVVRAKHELVSGSEVIARHVATTPVWGALSALGGALVLLAGAAIALRSGRWAAMSARYEAPVADPADEGRARARADATMWTALERGEDPTTADDPADLQ